jgi:hypothetical protein
LVRIDFTGWTPGAPVSPEVICAFDDRVRGINGSCLLGPNVLAVADCFAGLAWRIDNADDFCLDEDAGFAYVTRHRANTFDRVPPATRRGSEVRHLAGDPFDATLVGPSSAAWGRGPTDHGRVAYVTTDGGTTAPPDGVLRQASLLRVQLDYGAQQAPS